jgi:hypothetical protein
MNKNITFDTYRIERVHKLFDVIQNDFNNNNTKIQFRINQSPTDLFIEISEQTYQLIDKIFVDSEEITSKYFDCEIISNKILNLHGLFIPFQNLTNDSLVTIVFSDSEIVEKSFRIFFLNLEVTYYSHLPIIHRVKQLVNSIKLSSELNLQSDPHPDPQPTARTIKVQSTKRIIKSSPKIKSRAQKANPIKNSSKDEYPHFKFDFNNITETNNLFYELEKKIKQINNEENPSLKRMDLIPQGENPSLKRMDPIPQGENPSLKRMDLISQGENPSLKRMDLIPQGDNHVSPPRTARIKSKSDFKIKPKSVPKIKSNATARIVPELNKSVNEPINEPINKQINDEFGDTNETDLDKLREEIIKKYEIIKQKLNLN